MATDGWVVPLTGVASTGNVTQLYPTWVTAGVDPAAATNAQLIRKPSEGALHSIQIEPDGSNGGTIQIWDIDGSEFGINVSSATTITNTQLTAAIAAGKAKLIWEQQFTGTVGSGPVNASGIFRAFMKGLAARFVSSADPVAGTCNLNLVVSGGFRKVESRGQP